MPKILIVEDDPDIAAIERDYLLLGGFEVSVCADGEEGLAEAKSGQYDLLLLDLMLPGKDGFSVCRELRAVSDIPILMVTARREDVDKSSVASASVRTITWKSRFPPAFWWHG